jgi:hypothetical protein
VPLFLQDADITIFRRRWPNAAEQLPFEPPQYDPHPPPYTTFPTITSHIHPFCIIYNTGAKLANTPDTKIPTPLFALSQSIYFIYSAWKKTPPQEWRNDGPPSQPPSSDDGNSGHGSRRYSTRSSTKRSRSGPDNMSQSGGRNPADADTSSNKRRMRPLQPPGLDASSVTSVSSRSLQELEDDELCPMPQSIHAWVDEVEDAVSEGDWNNFLHNDKDIGDYRLESPREVAVLLESNL